MGADRVQAGQGRDRNDQGYEEHGRDAEGHGPSSASPILFARIDPAWGVGVTAGLGASRSGSVWAAFGQDAIRHGHVHGHGVQREREAAADLRERGLDVAALVAGFVGGALAIEDGSVLRVETAEGRGGR